MADVVRLLGEGGAEWQFELPLGEVYADQVKKHALKPADDESAQAVAHLLADPEADSGDSEQPPSGGSEESSVDAMSGKQLDELAERLEVPDWKAGAKVPAKKEALKAFIAAKAAADDAAGEDPADLDDDDLHAKAAELGLDLDANADRDTVLAAVRAKLAE